MDTTTIYEILHELKELRYNIGKIDLDYEKTDETLDKAIDIITILSTKIILLHDTISSTITTNRR